MLSNSLSLFYYSYFLDNIEDDIVALTTMFAYSLDGSEKNKTSKEFYGSIYEIIMQLRISKVVKNIGDVCNWIEDIKFRLEVFISEFKECI